MLEEHAELAGLLKATRTCWGKELRRVNAAHRRVPVTGSAAQGTRGVTARCHQWQVSEMPGPADMALANTAHCRRRFVLVLCPSDTHLCLASSTPSNRTDTSDRIHSRAAGSVRRGSRTRCARRSGRRGPARSAPAHPRWDFGAYQHSIWNNS